MSTSSTADAAGLPRPADQVWTTFLSALEALPADARLRDVVEVVRADEAHHRDVNHGFANELAGLAEPQLIPAVWPHEQLQPHWREAA